MILSSSIDYHTATVTCPFCQASVSYRSRIRWYDYFVLFIVGRSAQRVPVVDVIRDFVTDPSLGALRNYGPGLARVFWGQLAALGTAVLSIRRDAVAALRATVRDVALTKEVGTDLSAAIGRLLAIHTSLLSSVVEARVVSNQRESSLNVTVDVHAILKRAEKREQDTVMLLDQLQYRTPISTVGKIHLERLEMTPVGVEHGELVHSVPLALNETVNLTHRE
jgi:hypothetical protein